MSKQKQTRKVLGELRLLQHRFCTVNPQRTRRELIDSLQTFVSTDGIDIIDATTRQKIDRVTFDQKVVPEHYYPVIAHIAAITAPQ
ncbi:hypothetical protein MZD04_gp320 [Pseudomonas phage Psa21]|uniref:Uncharacterized protein n=1 Tax=Pseudomonas phage Psa21 TaxID=2530023 RepID=A0A481W4U8_9CAUD|nr:hypothetical protein MZD04_gp320 [Pseudomonas phage Psa21]QBJ02846.1 hypothetical protein PSA21_320 [Pseudomonas phage Psa21]